MASARARDWSANPKGGLQIWMSMIMMHIETWMSMMHIETWMSMMHIETWMSMMHITVRVYDDMYAHDNT